MADQQDQLHVQSVNSSAKVKLWAELFERLEHLKAGKEAEPLRFSCPGLSIVDHRDQVGIAQ